jgi:putative SOS response-associated peptidase YedK
VCGRFVQVSSPERLALQFGALDVTSSPHRPRYNVAPSTEVPAVIDAGGRRLGMLQWGFVPSWAKDPDAGPRPINARVEGVATSRLFATPLRRQRCIVPVDAWYEWQEVDGVKQPWSLIPTDGEAAPIAAVWSMWRGDPSMPPRSTVALLTTAAKGAAATVHDRMPLRIPSTLLDAWLQPGAADEEIAALLQRSVDAPMEVEVRKVSRRVNDVRNDDATLLEPS